MQLQRAATQSAAPLQRVGDTGLRDGIDVRMDTLKARSSLIFAQLQQQSESWAAKWGTQAKEKAEDQVRKKLNNEKGESIEKQAIKKLWDQLEPAEKREIVWEASKAAIKVFGTVISETSLPSRSGSDERREPQEREQSRSESSDSGIGSAVVDAVSSLSALTSDDVETAYEFFKTYRKTRKKIEEYKQEVITTAGKVGQEAGAFAGTLRDEHEFENLIKAHAGEFKGAKAAYLALKADIESNDDSARYEEELDALHNAFTWLTGPQLAFMLNGGLVAVKRLEFPELCRETRDGITATSRTYSGLEKLTKNAAKLRYGGVDNPQSQIGVAQETTASAIRRITRQSWKKVTKWGSVPSGVNNIKKLKDDTDGATFLAAAKTKAQATGDGGSNRDAETTQKLYDALKSMNVNNAASLGTTTAEINRISAVLASKT